MPRPMPQTPVGFAARWQGPAVLMLIVAILFGNAARFGYLEHDDDRHIWLNARMQALSVESVKEYWEAPYLGLYIPLTYTYWSGVTAVSYLLDGDVAVPTIKPWLFHASNIFWHGVNGVLVYVFLTGFGVTALPALIGALFFAMHPVQVEAVAWISGCKDVLSGFFGLLSLLFYSWFVRRLTPQAGVKAKDRSNFKLGASYVAAYAAFACAILAKPAEVILPPLFVLIALYWEGRPRLRSLLLVVPHLLTVAYYLKVASVTQTTEGPFPPVPLWARPLVAGDAWIFYLQKVLLPFSFALDYGRRPDLILHSTPLLVRAVLPYLLAAGLLWTWWKRPSPTIKFVAVALGAFAIALAPTLGFLQFAYQFFSVVCDRYAYLAMLAPAAVAAVVAMRLESYKPTVPVAGGVLLFFSWQTARLVDTWSSERKLFSHSLQEEPNGAVALVGFSNDTANSGNWQGTVPLLQRAQAALPEWSRPHNNMGTTYMNLHEPAKAAAEYAEAIRLHPLYPLAHCNRCAALTDLERYDEAEKECREALRMSPEYQQAYVNLASVLRRRHDLDGAEKNFRRASELGPTNFAPRHALALTQMEQSKWSEALEQLTILHRQYPNNVQTVIDTGRCLVNLGRREEALQLYGDYAAHAPDDNGRSRIAAAMAALREGPAPAVTSTPESAPTNKSGTAAGSVEH